MTDRNAADEAAFPEKANPLLAEVLMDLEILDERPNCYQGFSIGHVKITTLGGKLNCKECASKTTCSSADPVALIERTGKPPCFGSAPHILAGGNPCPFEKCAVSTECQALHDQLFRLHAVGLISDARSAVERYLLGRSIPSPVLPPVGEEIRVAKVADEASVPAATAAAKASISIVSTTSSASEKKDGLAKFSLFDVSVVNIQREALIKESDAGLLELVRCLSHCRLTAADKESQEYSAVRGRFLAASFLLNERGSCAPRFRERKSLDFKPLPSDRLYACDLQIVDLHWLSIHGNPLPVAEWKGVFMHSGLDYIRAWDFACHKVKAESKVMLLALGGVEEHCLSVIRREEVRMIWKNLLLKRDKVIRDIKIGIAKLGGRMKLQPDLLFQTYSAFCAVEGDVGVARQMFGYMGHGVPTSTEFSRRVAWLKRVGLLTAKSPTHAT